MKGCIFDIQRCCMEDGPGIRTTVFLKGCNLRCSWCHNPESFSRIPQLAYDKEKCVGCGACKAVCSQQVHSFRDGEHNVEFEKCTLCGKCIGVCKAEAVSRIGTWMTVEEVLQIILKDKKYYDQSGGGVTFSGGEPTMQYDFLMELLKACRSAGVLTAIETNGIGEEKEFKALIQATDLFLVDFKIADSKEHRKYTGQSNEKVRQLLSMLTRAGKKAILRCPVIPGINDESKHVAGIIQCVSEFPCISKAEVMPYHGTGIKKWEKIGLTYSLKNVKPMSREEKIKLENRIRSGTHEKINRD